MAEIFVDDSRVCVELSWWERFFAGGRTRMTVPLAEVVATERVERPTRYSAAPGARAGLLVTGVLKVGRWGLGTSTSRFLSVRRSVPAVRVRVTEGHARELGYDELLISSGGADAVVRTLTEALDRV